MRRFSNLLALASVTALPLLAGCVPTADGYYDARGNWIPRNHYDTTYAPAPGGQVAVDYDNSYTAPAYSYTRRGYYDYNGYYMPADSGLNVPPPMFPPRGMCRVWFSDRSTDSQPPVESCDGIKTRVPAGAYVIYGG